MDDLLDDMEVVRDAKSVPLEVIQQLPEPYQYQFARVRDDVDLNPSNTVTEHGGDK